MISLLLRREMPPAGVHKRKRERLCYSCEARFTHRVFLLWLPMHPHWHSFKASVSTLEITICKQKFKSQASAAPVISRQIFLGQFNSSTSCSMERPWSLPRDETAFTETACLAGRALQSWSAPRSCCCEPLTFLSFSFFFSFQTSII